MTKKKMQKTGAESKISEFPEPKTVELSAEDYPLLHAKGLKPIILTRLTVVIFDNEFLIHYNKSDIAKKYDLLSIVPKSAQCLIALHKSSFRFDILGLRPDLIFDVKWSRKLYNECIEKYVHFELQYSPAIVDREDRRRIISLAQTFQSIGKSRKIIFTSGAKLPIELRAPGDVSNLAFIFGLNENQGKEAIKKNCLDVYRTAMGRKIGVYRVRVERVDQGGDSDSDEAMDSD